MASKARPIEVPAEGTALRILNANRIMAIATLRPDGWPQNTVVGYANKAFDIYFLVFRGSQKFANIGHDGRVSIAVAPEPASLNELKAVYAGARAREITDPAERDEAWRLLMERHANLSGFSIPNAGDAAFMKAMCEHVSVLDFAQGLGHHEQLTIGQSGLVLRPSKKAHWPAPADIAVSST